MRINFSNVYKFAMETTSEATDKAQANKETSVKPRSEDRPGTDTVCTVE